MFVKSVDFLKSVSINSEKVWFENKNEIVFVGRSNVGKSSIMNFIFNKKDLVKTSSKPGKTRTANIFLVNNKYYFTDLPGYGFAKLGKEIKENLDGLISWYLEERRNYIKKVVILIDSKIGPQDSDFAMYKYIVELSLPVLILLSKVDKLGKNEISKSLTFAQENFFGQQIIPVSSTKKIGLDTLDKIIKQSLV